MEFLRDQIWQLLLAVVGIVIAIVFFLLERKKKSLLYEIVSKEELLTMGEELRGKVKILFNKKPIQNVSLLIVKFTNDGNIPILPSDFYENLYLSFQGDTEIFSAEITNCLPLTFRPELIVNKNSVSLVPTLINSKESFSIKFILSKPDYDAKVNSRIVGISEVKKSKKERVTQFQFIAMIFVVFLFIVVLVSFLISPDLGINLSLNLMTTTIGITITIILIERMINHRSG